MSEIRQEKARKKLLEYLRHMPVIQSAVRNAGITRATYYRWVNMDPDFKEEVDNALQEGREVICDMSEMQLFALIKEKKISALMYFLRRHSPRYGGKVAKEWKKPMTPADYVRMIEERNAKIRGTDKKEAVTPPPEPSLDERIKQLQEKISRLGGDSKKEDPQTDNSPDARTRAMNLSRRKARLEKEAGKDTLQTPESR